MLMIHRIPHHYTLVFATITTLLMGASIPTTAHALSCLPTEDYVTSVIGEEDIVIFEGTSENRTETSTYTRETLSVGSVHQGYVEDTVLVYHEKHPDWQYLCNNGPQAVGQTGLYVVQRDTFGMYHVTQRLTVSETIAKNLVTAIDAAAIMGERVTTTPTDRSNQVLTTLTDLFSRVSMLLSEYTFWKSRAGSN
jgi:hypothetical protein